jgi:GR25 family glycosyltransferase involved in LPS biosynthesis
MGHSLSGHGMTRYMLLVRNKRYGFLLATVFILALAAFQFRPHESTTWALPKVKSASHRRVDNSTLGFGAIYALSLLERSDKRDAMQLAAALSGLQLSWVDGVKGDEIHPKAVPMVHNDKENPQLEDGELGCWRGHMNILREVIRTGILSALVLEDDADWDIQLPEQMQQFSIAAREVLASRPYHSPSGTSMYLMPDSPYGADWDVLWIGHCGGWPPTHRFNQYHSIIRADTTVPPIGDIADLLYDVPENQLCSAHTGRDPVNRTCDAPRLALDERIVQYKTGPFCTAGYAVSQQGARKMLSQLAGDALNNFNAAIDFKMRELCQGDKEHGEVDEMRCLTVTPPYIGSHRRRGPLSGDSDIRQGSSTQMRTVGESRGLVWSVRMNMRNLILGLEPESQYVRDEKDGKRRFRTNEEYRVPP